MREASHESMRCVYVRVRYQTKSKGIMTFVSYDFGVGDSRYEIGDSCYEVGDTCFWEKKLFNFFLI